jgi:hypothetical protein
MTQKRCISPSEGRLLHGYELGILSPEDTERFEKHLMSCDYCLSEAQDFDHQATLLATDATVGALLDRHTGTELTSSAGQQASPPRQQHRAVWLLAVAAALILSVVSHYLIYQSQTVSQSARIRRVASISLYPDRSASAAHVISTDNVDLAVSFYVPHALPTTTCNVELVDHEGTVLFEDEAFTGFDVNGRGMVLVPNELLTSDRYVLRINDPGVSGPQYEQEYRFTVGQ